MKRISGQVSTAMSSLLVAQNAINAIGGVPPYQYTPITLGIALSKEYSDSGDGNNFHLASWVRSTGTKATVGVFGEGVGDGAGSRVWGGNFVAYANNPTAVAIGTEVNFGALVSGGSAYGVVIASAGDYATNAHFQMQANTSASRPTNGIVFNRNGSIDPVAGALLSTAGAVACNYGVDFRSAAFAVASMLLPNNKPISYRNAANTSSLPALSVTGSDFLALGTGSGYAGILFHPGGAEAMRILPGGTVGIGLTAPDTAQKLHVSGGVRLDVATATSATGGGASALPAAPVGYVIVNIGGTARKVPYYAT